MVSSPLNVDSSQIHPEVEVGSLEQVVRELSSYELVSFLDRLVQHAQEKAVHCTDRPDVGGVCQLVV